MANLKGISHSRRTGLLVRQIAILLLMAGTAAMSGGCTLAKALAYYAGPQTEKIAPEYGRLPGKTAVVYVWAPPETLWDYPKIRLDIASYVGGYLKQNVKDVTLVDPLRVESYLEKQTYAEQDPAAIGREFNADAVVHLAVYKFSMRDPGMSQFLRGRLASSVVVYESLETEKPAERIPLPDVNVTVPEEGPVGFVNARPEQVRQATYNAFAVAVGRKFHEYERPLDEKAD